MDFNFGLKKETEIRKKFRLDESSGILTFIAKNQLFRVFSKL